MNRVTLSILAATLLAPTLAHACGGLFCDGTFTVPVEQGGERILFEIDPTENTVTTTVDIQYEGAPQSFSWILPIPVSDAMPVPELAIAPETLLSDLRFVSNPQITPPPFTCNGNVVPPPSAGGGDDDDSAGGDDDDFAGGDDDVTVIDLPSVGPFDNELITATNVGALVAWLNDNGYLVTEAMEPALADYVLGGLSFLGVRLLADADTAEIAPLSITSPGQEPMIPLRLTAISAEPDMRITVFIAADGPWQSTNWTTMELDVENLVTPWVNRSNYDPLLRWQIDQVGGRGFVIERATVAPAVPGFLASAPELEAILSRRSHLTRLRARVHPEEMTVDPVFGPGTVTFDGVHDLSGREPVELCDEEEEEVACGSLYCGRGSLCATTTAEIDGCVCAAGTVAREITSPQNAGWIRSDASVVCQDASWDFLGSAGPSADDVCPQGACGAGTCTVVNGFPTCACDPGNAAVPTETGLPTCVPTVSEHTFEESLPRASAQIPVPFDEVETCGACAQSSDRGASLLAALTLLVMSGLRRRREV